MEAEQVVDTPVVEESFEAYVTRANAAEQTGTLHELVEDAPAEPVAAVAETPEPEKPKGKPRNDPQARIDEITAKHKEAERRLEEAAAKAARLEAEIAASRTPKPAAQPVAAAQTFPEYGAWASQPGNEGKPYEDYIDARSDWRYDQRQRHERQTQMERQAVVQVKQRVAAFHEKLAPSIADDPTFLEGLYQPLANAEPVSSYGRLPNNAGFYMLDDPQRTPVPAPTFENWLIDQVYKSASRIDPKAVLRHLNQQEVQRLATLHPDEVIWELAKVGIQTSVPAAASRGSAPVPKKSAAPDPIQPLGSSAGLSGDEPGEDEPIEAHIRRENSRDRKAGRL